MTSQLEKTVIIGVGLLGGSLGLALKARGLARHVVGVGHRATSLEAALRVGAVDETSLDVSAAVHDADLIVVCTPAARVSDMLDLVRAKCPAGAVVTDVASTKAAICGHAAAVWPRPRRFIGSHPMAGSEKFGPENARVDLYEGSVCLVETGDALDPAARAAVVALWEGVGAHVVDIDPVRHDDLLARSSHLPHVLASALASITARSGATRDVIGRGFRDMTRIAGSRPEIWTEICLTNRNALLNAFAEFQHDLDVFRAALVREDAAALGQFFESGRRARKDAVRE